MLSWILAILGGLVAYIVYDSKRKHAYWRDKGVRTPKMVPLLSCMPDLMKLGQGPFDQEWTKKLGRVFGYFDGPRPVLVTSDLEMLKHVMVKDFSHFVNRRDTGLNGEVLGKGVTMTRDQHWKVWTFVHGLADFGDRRLELQDVRNVLVPTFASAKLRQTNDLVQDCCKNMVENMSKLATTGEEFEAKELYGRVAMDVTAAAFFGTQVDSQNESDNPFVKHAKGVTNFAIPLVLLTYFCPWMAPYLAKLGFQLIPKEHTEFLVTSIEEIMRLRKASNQTRKDFLQLMLSVQDDVPSGKETPTVARSLVQELDIVSEVLSDSKPTEKIHARSDYKLTTKEIVAQAVMFFMAGYDTTSTSLSFLTYCMATNPEIQEKLRKEIQTVMQGKEEVDYNTLAEMEYLDQCVNESLRLYPVTSRTERECNEDWEYKGLKVEKGTMIGIPIYEIQRDPEYWPNPELYDPERFSKDNKQHIKSYTFMAFGQGPRNCIGMRFALFEMKMVMVSLLLKFRVLPCSRTQIPLQLKDIGFLSAKDGVWVKLQKI